MNRRKYKSNPQKLLEQGKKIMMNSDSADSKYNFRVFSVNLVLSGMSAAEVAETAGVTRSTVSNWVKTADEQGFDALKTVKPSGRRPKLNKTQREEIAAILQKKTDDYGYKVWDGPSLSDLIQKEFHIRLSIRQCQRLFHELGYSRIRPQVFPSKGYEDTEAREDFKKDGMQP